MRSVRGLCDVLAAASASVLKMLDSVAGVVITAFMFDPAPFWLCVVITAYMFDPAPLWLCGGNAAYVLNLHNIRWLATSTTLMDYFSADRLFSQ